MKTMSVLPPRDQQRSSNKQSPGKRTPDELVTIGHIKAALFWPVLLSAFLLLSGLMFLASKGAIALAIELPGTYTIQATTLEIINGKLELGVSGSNPTVPVAIVTAQEEIATHLRISKDACIPSVGRITFIISVAKPAYLFGARTDIQALSANLILAHHFVASTNALYGIRITANEKLYDVTIASPFLSIDSLAFPDVSITGIRSGSC